jgi:TPR repeat protein
MDLPLAMRNVNRLALIFLFATAAPECAVAGQLEDGLAALDKLDFTTAVKLLEPLAEQGNVEAQVRLGVICRNGLGMPVDFTQAVKWYRLAADQDNPQAQFDLGELYADGQGMSVDYAEMVRLHTRAGEQGYLDAQDVLGYMYEYGVGVSVDYAKAYFWFDLAAARGGKNDAAKRDRVATKLAPEQIAEAQKLRPGMETKIERCLPLALEGRMIRAPHQDEPRIGRKPKGRFKRPSRDVWRRRQCFLSTESQMFLGRARLKLWSRPHG